MRPPRARFQLLPSVWYVSVQQHTHLISSNSCKAGDLLRAEQDREGSTYGDLIKTCIREGTIVPMEVTIKLLEAAMLDACKTKSGLGWEDGKGRFLIDGFPRKMDQALKFEEDVRFCL